MAGWRGDQGTKLPGDFGSHVLGEGLAKMNCLAKALLTVVVVTIPLVWGSPALAQSRGPVASSLLLLIDASGSMGTQ